MHYTPTATVPQVGLSVVDGRMQQLARSHYDESRAVHIHMLFTPLHCSLTSALHCCFCMLMHSGCGDARHATVTSAHGSRAGEHTIPHNQPFRRIVLQSATSSCTCQQLKLCSRPSSSDNNNVTSSSTVHRGHVAVVCIVTLSSRAACGWWHGHNK